MAFVRSFENYFPPARYDDTPFTTARIQESEESDSGFVTVESVALDPLDADPSAPQARDFTTDEAELESGWYRVQWVDAAAATFNSDAVFFPSHERPGVLATPADVGRVLHRDISDDELDAVTRALEVAEAWVRNYLRDPNLGTGVASTVSISDVDPRGYFSMPSQPSLVSVRHYPGASLVPLASAQWTWDGTGVRLRSSFDDEYWSDPRYASGLSRTAYVEVVATLGASSAVSPVVRDATALAAASLWTRSPRLGKGFKGENIGDYGYTLASGSGAGDDPLFSEAKSLLRPFRAHGPMVT